MSQDEIDYARLEMVMKGICPDCSKKFCLELHLVKETLRIRIEENDRLKQAQGTVSG